MSRYALPIMEGQIAKSSSIQLRSRIDRLCFQCFSRFGLPHRKPPCGLLLLLPYLCPNQSVREDGVAKERESLGKKPGAKLALNITRGKLLGRSILPIASPLALLG